MSTTEPGPGSFYCKEHQANSRHLCFACAVDKNAKNTDGAYTLVAQMHAAALGEIRGPRRGVVEDIVDLRAAHDELLEACVEAAAILPNAEPTQAMAKRRCLKAVRKAKGGAT